MARLLEEVRVAVMDGIVEQLRDRACPAGLPHTGDDPRDDHGHTDCWLHHLAADEIDRLRALVNELADAEQGDSEQAWSDALTALYQAVGR